MEAFLTHNIFSDVSEKELFDLLDKIKSYGVDNMEEFLDRDVFSDVCLNLGFWVSLKKTNEVECVFVVLYLSRLMVGGD